MRTLLPLTSLHFQLYDFETELMGYMMELMEEPFYPRSDKDCAGPKAFLCDAWFSGLGKPH